MTRGRPPRRRRKKREARTDRVSWFGIFRAILALAALLYQWWNDQA